MSQRLLIVEDAFNIPSWGGVVVVPGPLQADGPARQDVSVLLKKRDGSISRATLSMQHTFQSPPPKELRWTCLLKGVRKEDLQIGTEVWIDD